MPTRRPVLVTYAWCRLSSENRECTCNRHQICSGNISPHRAKISSHKPWRQKIFFLNLKIIINVLVSYFRFIQIFMLWTIILHLLILSVLGLSLYIRIYRIKMVPRSERVNDSSNWACDNNKHNNWACKNTNQSKWACKNNYHSKWACKNNN